jgi:hypothetical protein
MCPASSCSSYEQSWHLLHQHRLDQLLLVLLVLVVVAASSRSDHSRSRQSGSAPAVMLQQL